MYLGWLIFINTYLLNFAVPELTTHFCRYSEQDAGVLNMHFGWIIMIVIFGLLAIGIIIGIILRNSRYLGITYIILKLVNLCYVQKKDLCSSSDQVLTKFWPSSDQVLTKFWPSSDQVLTKFWPSSESDSL
jgi:hypothetical protein